MRRSIAFKASLQRKVIVLACAVCIGTAVLLGGLVSLRTGQVAIDTAIASLEAESRLLATEFRSAFKHMENDAFILARTPPVGGIVRSQRHGGQDPVDGSQIDQWRDRLATNFAAVLEERPYYTQARFIGVADGGREIVRVDRRARRLHIVGVDTLQTKADEPYFVELLDTDGAAPFFSKVTYNREFGQVENQLVPTIRFILPVRDDAGTLFGALVINADYPALIRHYLEEIDHKANIFVINESGDYIEQSKSGQIFDFQYHQSAAYSPSPLIARVATAPERGPTFIDDERIVSFERRQDTGAATSDIASVAILASTEEVFAKAREARSDSLRLAAFALVISGVTAAFAANRLTRPLRLMAGSIARARAAPRSRGPLANADAARPRNYDQRLLELPTHRDDEIGALATSFEELVDDLVKEREESLLIFRTVVDTIVTIDESGRILSCNPALEAMFGYHTADVLGRNVSILMPASYAKTHQAHIDRYGAAGAHKIIGATREVKGKRRDGSTFPIELSVSEIHLGDKRLFVGIIRDASERRKMEIMKDQFVSTVNHEIRSPLTSIKASLETLRRESQDTLGETGNRIVDIAHRNCDRLRRLVDDILDMEKVAAGKMDYAMTATPIGPLVADVVDRHQHLAAQYNTAFTIVMSVDDAAACRLDPSRFNQALVNLLSNAVKFSPAGQEVVVTVEERGADRVRVSVTDSGPGVPDDFRSRIFTRFAQADGSSARAQGGSGLGLSITKSIIEAFGGGVGFDSREGAGSTFYFDLPTVAAGAVDAAVA